MEKAKILPLLGKLANLEGSKNIPLPNDLDVQATLADIDCRLIRIELANGIDPPAPMVEPTWDSTTFRLSRAIDRDEFPTYPMHSNETTKSMATIEAEASFSTLRRVIASIYPDEASWLVEGDEALHYKLVQKLAHAAGRLKIKTAEPVLTIQQAYLFAVGLSLQMRQRRITPDQLRSENMRPGCRRFRLKDSCCDGCSCSCHVSRDLEAVGRRRRSTPPRRRYTFGFGWIQRIWCGRKSGCSDTDSTCSDSTYA
jgi:hypothetical protein